jgi:hypothetical protein
MSDLIGKIDSPASITGVIAPELNIIGVIANGIKGDKGDTGDIGPKGDIGNTGATGLEGDTGATGTNGTDGDRGIQGESGLAGAKGDTGLQGIDGTNGIDGIQGDTGFTGAVGATGLTGLTGEPGPEGDTGVAGYTPIKDIDYFDGATGATGAKGDTGLKGDTGITGATGAQGEVGPKGDIDPTLANQITTLEGTGWVNETVKGNADALAAHQADIVTVAEANKIPRAEISGLLADNWMRLTRINSMFISANSAQIDVSIPTGFKKLRVWFSGRTTDAAQTALTAAFNDSGTFLTIGFGGATGDAIPGINDISMINNLTDNKPFTCSRTQQATSTTVNAVGFTSGVFLITSEISKISFKCGTSIKSGSILTITGVK